MLFNIRHGGWRTHSIFLDSFLHPVESNVVFLRMLFSHTDPSHLLTNFQLSQCVHKTCFSSLYCSLNQLLRCIRSFDGSPFHFSRNARYDNIVKKKLGLWSAEHRETSIFGGWFSLIFGWFRYGDHNGSPASDSSKFQLSLSQNFQLCGNRKLVSNFARFTRLKWIFLIGDPSRDARDIDWQFLKKMIQLKNNFCIFSRIVRLGLNKKRYCNIREESTACWLLWRCLVEFFAPSRSSKNASRDEYSF